MTKNRSGGQLSRRCSDARNCPWRLYGLTKKCRHFCAQSSQRYSGGSGSCFHSDAPVRMNPDEPEKTNRSDAPDRRMPLSAPGMMSRPGAPDHLWILSSPAMKTMKCRYLCAQSSQRYSGGSGSRFHSDAPVRMSPDEPDWKKWNEKPTLTWSVMKTTWSAMKSRRKSCGSGWSLSSSLPGRQHYHKEQPALTTQPAKPVQDS